LSVPARLSSVAHSSRNQYANERRMYTPSKRRGVARTICHSLLLFYVRRREKQLEWKGFSNIIPPANENHRVSSSLSLSLLFCYCNTRRRRISSLYMQIPPSPSSYPHTLICPLCATQVEGNSVRRASLINFGTNRMNLKF